MRIFLAGGSGVIGSRLIPELVEAGHDITATTRRAQDLRYVRERGAQGVVVDVYDAPQLAAVVAEAAPHLVLHELTDLGEFDTQANARLRRAGTANLVAAAEAAGVERMIVQSNAGEYTAGKGLAFEDDPIKPSSAIETMERLVCRMPRATVLRYGLLYGPDTWYAPGARMANAVVACLVSATPVVTSFVHIDDVVTATVQAIGWPDGAYNIVDDEPAPATKWLPAYAEGLGAPTPKVVVLSEGAPRGRGVSNAKARAAGWAPRYASWREGFPRR